MDDDEVLGVGSYNCAILRGGDTVYRIMALPNAEMDYESDTSITRMASRAGQILSQFRRVEHMLGPSVLRELQAGKWLNPTLMTAEMRAWVEGIRCRPVQEARPLDDYRFYVQVIEYARGGTLKKAVDGEHDKDNAFAFMLIWFFYVAQAQFGFRHRDLKPANIVIRTYEGPRSFRFNLDGADCFQIETDRVPVVIDLDFGSFISTNDTVRQQDGTTFFMPLEISWDLLLEQELGQEQHGDAVDWYGLGASLLVYWCGRPEWWYEPFGVELELAELLDARLPLKGVRLDAINALCFHVVVANIFELELPNQLVGPVEESGLMSTIQARFLTRHINRTIVGNRRRLLAVLLEPRPKRRYMDGEPWRLLTEQPLFTRFRENCTKLWRPHERKRDAPEEEEVYTYGKYPVLSRLPRTNARRRTLVAALESLPNIRTMCLGCAADTRHMCECCREPFCSVGCQARYH